MNKRIAALAILVAAVSAAAGLFAGPSHGAANHSTGGYCRKFFGACLVTLTGTGPSPSTVKIPAEALGLERAYKYVQFQNRDSVAHTVVFANGLCSLTIAPEDYGSCSDNFPFFAGSYAYEVDGKFPGKVVTVPVRRSVTLTARTHTIRGGTRLTLHGLVNPPGWMYHVSHPPGWRNYVTVIVLARHNSKHPFRPIATVSQGLLARVPGSLKHRWTLTVRPGATTTYIAKVTSQPPQGQIWTNAKSRPFTVRIRREEPR